MKKLLIILPIFLLAYNITNTKTFTKSVTPDTLITTLNITINDNSLQNLLNKTNKVIKNSNICEEINYNFSPYYEYKNKKRVFVGYIANIHETCKFKNPKDFSSLLEKIKNYGKVSLNSISYISSKQKETIKELKISAYNFALKEAKTLSNALNKTCILKNISFNPYLPKPIKNYRPIKLATEALQAPLPKKANKVKLTTTYQIECF